MRRPILETYAPDGSLANRIRQNPGWEAVSREAYRRGVVGPQLWRGAGPLPADLRHGLSALPGGCLAALPRHHDRGRRLYPLAPRPGGGAGALSAASDAEGWCGPHRRHLGHREAWRQRYRRHDDGGAAGGRSSSPDRPQMVRQQCQWRPRAGDRAARGCGPGHEGPRPLSRAADPGRRHGKSAALPPAEGQARHHQAFPRRRSISSTAGPWRWHRPPKASS